MKRLPKPPYICLVTEGAVRSHNFPAEKTKIVDAIRHAVTDGVNIVQIRERSLFGRHLFDLVSTVVDCLTSTEAVVLVNDRIDIALSAGADGVHLPESGIPAAVVRRVFPADFIIGVSTHSVESAREAVRGGANYVYFGPVFATAGKDEPAGLSRLSETCRELAPFPVIAIGGINELRCSAVLDAGAAGIAAIRGLNDPHTRSRIIRELRAHL